MGVLYHHPRLDSDQSLDLEILQKKLAHITFGEFMMELKPVHVLIVSPAFNEELYLEKFVRYWCEKPADAFIYKMLIIDDGSTDHTLQLCKELQAEFPDQLRYLSFFHNHGHAKALVAGLSNVGDWPDAVITMDVDFEHPPELVSKMLEAWQEGYYIVNMRREVRHDLAFRKKFQSRIFYILSSWWMNVRVNPGMADFRLWDAHLLRSLGPYIQNMPGTRFMPLFLKCRQTTLNYEQSFDPDRQSKFNLRKNLQLAFSSTLFFSKLPYIFPFVLSFLSVLFFLLYGIYVIVSYYQKNVIPGWSSVVLITMGFGALQTMALGYLIFFKSYILLSSNMPQFLVKESSYQNQIPDKS